MKKKKTIKIKAWAVFSNKGKNFVKIALTKIEYRIWVIENPYVSCEIIPCEIIITPKLTDNKT